MAAIPISHYLSARALNVHELDDDEKVVLRLCFVPKDIDAPGDVMLGQKLGLETDELNARAVANLLSE